MTARAYVVPLVLAPVAAVALFWILASSTGGTSSGWLAAGALVPVVGALVWASARTASFARRVSLAIATLLVTVVLWLLSMLALFFLFYEPG